MFERLQDLERELCAGLLDLACVVEDFDRADQVLDGLHEATSRTAKVSVLGAFALPDHWGDAGQVKIGGSVFLHASVPKGWWNEYLSESQKHLSPGYAAIHLAMAAFTLTEAMQMMEPLGADRWGIDLHYKYGMRDVLSCPVGGRWVVVYWTSDVLTNRLTPGLRALLTMGATTTAVRLQKLAEGRVGKTKAAADLTPREIAVLRNLSCGKPIEEIAKVLGLGRETVRTHLKKAQAKLGVRTQSHAVAEAIRRKYCP